MEYDLDRLHRACSVSHLPRAQGKTMATCFQILGYLQLGTKNHDSEFTQIAVGCIDQNHMRNFMKTCHQVFEDHNMVVINSKQQGYSVIWTVRDGYQDKWDNKPEQTVTFFPSIRKEDWEMARPPFLYLEDIPAKELHFPNHAIMPDRSKLRWA